MYAGKSCTDEVVTLIAVCRAKGYETRFVKLVYSTPEGTYTHSVAEIKLPDGWYMVDVNGNWGERKGEVTNGERIHGYRLWKKGRDAWDIGLEDFSSQTKLS